MDLVALVREHLAEAHLDVVGSLIATFVEALMGAEVDAICGTAYHQPRAHQSAHTAIAAVLRETRLGTTRAQRSQSVARGATSPTGSKRAVSFARLAPTSVIATCYVLGVSTRRLEKLAWALGITKLSKSQISQDGPQPQTPSSEPFAPVPQTAGPYPIVLGRCPGGQGTRGWQDRQRPRARRHWGECARAT